MIVPSLDIEDLEKNFGAIRVLDGVTLAARAGEVVVVMGGSGSGKSTLLRCIVGLEVPEGGDIRVTGIAIPYLDRRGRREIASASVMRAIRRRVGFCFQSAQLWSHRTVMENIIEAPVHVAGRHPAAAIAQAEALLETMGLSDKRDDYPAQLSGGQQQRVGIARALAIEPDLLLFDEPTAGLDPMRTRDVLAVMRRLAGEGRTMIVVTHEIDFAREVADRILFMADGRIVAEGIPEAMFGPDAPSAFSRFCYQLNDDEQDVGPAPGRGP